MAPRRRLDDGARRLMPSAGILMTLGTLSRHILRFRETPGRPRPERIVGRSGAGAVGGGGTVDPGQARSGAFHRAAVRHCRAVVARPRVGARRYAGTHPELYPNLTGDRKPGKANWFGTFRNSRPNTVVQYSEYRKPAGVYNDPTDTAQTSAAVLSLSVHIRQHLGWNANVPHYH